MAKRVLLIGGSGTISSEVSRVCAINGWDVTTLTRGTGWRNIMLQKDCRNLFADIRNRHQFENAINNESYDVVIDFYSYVPEHLKNKLDVLQGHFKQYVFISSVAAYDADDNAVVTEKNTCIGPRNNQYGWNKAICECYLREYFKKSESTFTIIRPGFMYGKLGVPYPVTEGYALGGIALLERIRNGKPIPFYYHDEIVKCRLLHTNDFAHALLPLFGNQEAYGEDFQIVSDKMTDWEKTLKLLENNMNTSIERVYVPIDRLLMVAPEWEHSVIQAKNSWDIKSEKFERLCKCTVDKTDYDAGVKQLVAFFEENRNVFMKYEEVLRTMDNFNYKMDVLCRQVGV